MATVYLPLGYPQQSGAFETIVFQGVMVRMYVNATDPRKDNQVFERKLLSDVSRMRGAAGSWAKAAWKYYFGSKYPSVIYQMVKSDVSGYWSDALEIFDLFNVDEQQAWRDAAPYAGTYNDPGRIFFGLATMLYKWNDEREGNFFDELSPNDINSGEVLKWWTDKAELRAWSTSPEDGDFYDDLHEKWVKVGAWTDVVDPYALSRTISETTEVGAYAEITIPSKQFRFYFKKNTDGANIRILWDGGEIGFADSNGTLEHQVGWSDVYREVKEYTFRLIHVGTAGQKMRLDGCKPLRFYTWIDRSLSVGSWESFSTGGPWGSEGYKSTGTGERYFEFNFIGRWFKYWRRVGPTFGPMRILVDGVQFGDTMELYRDVELTEGVAIGPLPAGLHRCRFEAASAGQIGLVKLLVLKKDPY